MPPRARERRGFFKALPSLALPFLAANSAGCKLRSKKQEIKFLLPLARVMVVRRRSRKLERSADFSHARRNLLPSAGTSGRFYWKHSITDPHAGGRSAISMVIRPAAHQSRRPHYTNHGGRCCVPGDSIILVLQRSAIILEAHLESRANLWQM